METKRLPQPVHERGETPPAPGDLELVRAFLSLHDHEQGDPDGFPPSLESLRWWLTSKASGRGRGPHQGPGSGVGPPGARRPHHQGAREHGSPRGHDGDRVPQPRRRADRAPGLLRLRRGKPDPRRGHGVRGAIGRILGSAFLAELDGRWERFRVCHDPGCSSVFFDRSKNKSGKWCSMASCGNRAKVRAFRERQAAE